VPEPGKGAVAVGVDQPVGRQRPADREQPVRLGQGPRHRRQGLRWVSWREVGIGSIELERSGGRGAPEGHVRRRGAHVVRDRRAFALEVAADRVAEGRVANLVEGPYGRGGEAARYLVLALGAGLEPRQAFPDAVLDALVVAGLEVQAVMVRGRAPVASVEGVLAAQEYRAGDRLAVAVDRELDHERLGQGGSEPPEEVQGEVGWVAAQREGARVQGIDHREPRRIEVRARQFEEAQARLTDAAALAAGFLALLGRESREEVLEIAVALVAPVELAVEPRHEARFLEHRTVLVRREQDVHRGQLARLGEFACRGEQRLPHLDGVCAGTDQQSRAARRRERRRPDQFGVIGQAVALIGAGPGEVEDELAPGMRLEVQGHCTGHAVAVARHHVRRRPAGRRRRRSGELGGRQEFVPQERSAAEIERVPVARRDFLDGVEDARADHPSRSSRSR
jgi:hypothetical protein